MKNLKLAPHDPILVDLEKLRRAKPRVAIDLRPTASATARAEGPGELQDAITVDETDPLPALIALSRRKFRR